MKLNPFGTVGDYDRAGYRDLLRKDLPTIRLELGSDEIRMFSLGRLDPALLLRELRDLELHTSLDSWTTLSPSGIHIWLTINVLRPLLGKPPSPMLDMLTWSRVSRRIQYRLPIRILRSQNGAIYDALHAALRDAEGHDLAFERFADEVLGAYRASIPAKDADRITRFYMTGQ